jgi:hypothetical protein
VAERSQADHQDLKLYIDRTVDEMEKLVCTISEKFRKQLEGKQGQTHTDTVRHSELEEYIMSKPLKELEESRRQASTIKGADAEAESTPVVEKKLSQTSLRRRSRTSTSAKSRAKSRGSKNEQPSHSEDMAPEESAMSLTESGCMQQESSQAPVASDCVQEESSQAPVTTEVTQTSIGTTPTGGAACVESEDSHQESPSAPAADSSRTSLPDAPPNAIPDESGGQTSKKIKKLKGRALVPG